MIDNTNIYGILMHKIIWKSNRSLAPGKLWGMTFCTPSNSLARSRLILMEGECKSTSLLWKLVLGCFGVWLSMIVKACKIEVLTVWFVWQPKMGWRRSCASTSLWCANPWIQNQEHYQSSPLGSKSACWWFWFIFIQWWSTWICFSASLTSSTGQYRWILNTMFRNNQVIVK